MQPSDGRCPTSSGPRFRCAKPAGHVDECSCREDAPAWVGPALQPGDVRTAVSTVRRRHARELAEVEHRAGMAEARAGMPHIRPPTPTEGKPHA